VPNLPVKLLDWRSQIRPSSPLEVNPFDLQRLCADEPLKAGGSGADELPQVHTLGIADTERAVSALFEWLAQAGLVPICIVPMNAVGLSECVESALSASRVERKSVAVALHIGEHSSQIAGATRGRLRFVRQISLGVDALVDAVQSAAREASIALTRAEAADLLLAHGIPQRTEQMGADGRLTGAMVLPLIQPVLQRLVVELKQSLRFGVEATERAQTVLTGMGPGSMISRLIPLISEQCGVVPASPQATTVSGASVTETWLGSSLSGLGLLPRQVTSRVEAGRMRHAMWVGAAATALLIGLDAWSTALDLRQQETNVTQLRARLAAAQPAAALHDRLTRLQFALDRATSARDSRFRTLPDGTAVLAMLAAHTPASIKLMHVQIHSEDQVPVCHVSGRATAANGVDPDSMLRAYVESLSGCRWCRTVEWVVLAAAPRRTEA
jgi:Tfp pilus assembly PilM family ATPase